jgi:hypothetical protein
MNKMERLTVDDLKLPPEVFALRLQRRAELRSVIESAMPEVEKAVEKYNLDDYYQKALNLIISGRARKAFDLGEETAATLEAYGVHQEPTAEFGRNCLIARRLVERLGCGCGGGHGAAGRRHANQRLCDPACGVLRSSRLQADLRLDQSRRRSLPIAGNGSDRRVCANPGRCRADCGNIV